MALQDELAELRAAVGAHVFDDPVAFRAAFDDFIPEGSASTGEVSLLVGAIATGALHRLRDQLALGADASTVIATQGDLMARDRGTSETSGARWALSVLAHAVGVVPADQVLTRPATPESVGTAERPAAAPPSTGADPGPTRGLPDDRTTRVVPDAQSAPPQTSTHAEPPYAEPPHAEPPHAEPVEAPRQARRAAIAAVVVLVLIVVAAAALLLLGDDEDPAADSADDRSSSSDSEPPPAVEEVLDEIEMTEGGKTVHVRLVHDDEDAFVVLLTDVDGELSEVDRVAASCPFLDTAYDADLEDQGNRQIAWGWKNDGTDGHGEYGEVQIDEDLVIGYGIGDAPCPGDPGT